MGQPGMSKLRHGFVFSFRIHGQESFEVGFDDCRFYCQYNYTHVDDICEGSALFDNIYGYAQGGNNVRNWETAELEYTAN